jgi:hypothetical protein
MCVPTSLCDIGVVCVASGDSLCERAVRTILASENAVEAWCAVSGLLSRSNVRASWTSATVLITDWMTSTWGVKFPKEVWRLVMQCLACDLEGGHLTRQDTQHDNVAARHLEIWNRDGGKKSRKLSP